MATVVQPIIEPDREAIYAHLQALFEPIREYYPDGLVELCHGPLKPDRAAFFNYKPEGLAAAADFAVSCNRRGENAYVGVNPRKPQTSTRGRADDTDVEISLFQFADLDREEAVSKALTGLPLRPTMVVLTGVTPHRRPHLYWQLEEPTQNMSAWTERQRNIAASVAGDAVINPSRIMRLAGTVNYPPPHKLERGYRMELTSLQTEFSTERPPLTPEQIDLAYPRREVLPAVNDIDLGGRTTLAAMSSGIRIADLINACRSGDEWHNNMVRLVAHLAAKGRSDAEILGLAAGLTLPGYHIEQTQREMLVALRTARSKWSLPEPQDSVEAEETAREAADSIFPLLDMDELEALPPPTWLIEGLIAEHGLSVVYGDPGAGKSFIVLDMALRIAFGMEWHGVPTQQRGVLYIAGEGARGLGKRVTGWRKEHGLEGADAPFLLLPIAISLLDQVQREKLLRTITAAVARAGFPIGLVVVDTVSRAMPGQDENAQEAMSLFVAAGGEIQVHTGGAVIAVHHTGKDSSRGMRGSTVLLGGCDASLKVTKDDSQRAMIEVEKQKDAEEAEPIQLTLKKVEWGTGMDKQESTLVPIKEDRVAVRPRSLSKRDAEQIFEQINVGWVNKAPWATTPQSKRRGRYLPDWIAREFDIGHDVALGYIQGWQERDYLRAELCDARNEVSGLRVLKQLEIDQ
jgi:hypothetical protein